ncbi:MAG: 5-carboxymethyl-2-hydroxymuconateDelta-isomerase [Acidobacteria bacterium]|nr:5-carboxymethyl-2-hydroxymuconateDelta-isomerase [Acidobacteriota bacterium]
MKIARIVGPSGPEFAVQGGDGSWITVGSMGITAATTAEVVAAAGALSAGIAGRSGGVTDPSFLSPIVAPGKVIAVGLNYADHMRETNQQPPPQPRVFSKFSTSITGPFDDIEVDEQLTQQLDYEGELAVVIGKRAKRVAEADALGHVFGYLTTADEVADPQALRIRTRVNGEIRQDGSTADMYFKTAYLISYLSLGMTWEPGDVILTGTPHGVGWAMKPQRFMAPGDVVECEVEGLGMLRNRVVAAAV